MSAITTKFVTDHQLTNEMSIEELSQYAPEMRNLLGDDREKRHQTRNHLQKGYQFSKEQAFALIPDQRNGRYISQVPVLEELGLEAEVNISLVPQKARLLEKQLSVLSEIILVKEMELENLNAPEKIISATKILEITKESNKIQKEHSEQCENEGIDFPDHFSLESVKKRLDEYNVSNIPDKQTLADVMIMLCIRPAEIKNLCIFNGGVTGYVKNRGYKTPRVFRLLEKNKKQLRDPGKPGSAYLSAFLKKDEFLPESGKPLLPSYLHKLGTVFASVAHGPKNALKANTYASEALRHSPNNYAFPSKKYTIVNMRKRGEPYNQAEPFCILDEN
ncbi:hypothetical protein C1646_664278 [Rhizophagus diaphanus]|nr:hypothetical protein C1646_664278 [Rhizophagus diaphanus] [Rhizophagus sp. MUCL 43196]